MNKVKIEVVYSQGVEGPLQTLLHVWLVSVPQFAGYEDVFPWHVAVGNTLSHFSLIPVDPVQILAISSRATHVMP